MKRNHLSLAIGLILGLSVTAHAQETTTAPASTTQAQQDKTTTLEAVKVTARRREESAQTVPVAVSAFSEEGLKELQASNVDGLQGAVPNMNIVQGRGSSSAVNVFIRGIGQPDALQTFDPGVGMYVDDVYYSRIQGALFSLFDVKQVEVLRGPQGTLYGKNSTGGAIKIVTRDPGEENGGSAELTVGNLGRLEGRFYGSMALSDTLSAGLALARIGNDGYMTDPSTDTKYNDEDTRAARLKFVYRPSDEFSASLSLDYTHQDNALTLGFPTVDLTRADLVYGTQPLFPAPTAPFDYEVSTSFNPDQGQELTHKGVAGHVQWKLADAWTLKSITARRKLDTAAFIDIDATVMQLGDVFVGIDQKQTSQEFQLEYDDGAAVQAMFGLYYLNEKVASHQEAYADDFLTFFHVPVDFLRTIDDDLHTTSKAAYAHASWKFAPSWTLAAGLRYSKDEKDYERTTTAFYGAPLTAFTGTFAFSTDASWTALTPSVSLQKELSDNVMVYGSANRGFKSGGFNGRANSAADTSAYDPEFVWTYELGLKMQSADRRLIGNLTVFHSDYEDFQARVSEITNPSAPIPAFSFPVLNAAKLAIDGIELEGSALVGSATKLTGQLSWLDARYEEFDDPRVGYSPGLAALHEHVPFSPEFTARLAATHSLYFDNGGMFTFGGDLSYRGETWLSVDNRPGLSQDAYTLYGAFGSYESADGDWQVRGGVRNLTDEKYKTDGQEFSSIGNIQTVYYGMPRNYYVAVRFNF